MNQKNDKFWIGLLAGLMVPIATYGILLTIYDALDASELTHSISFSPSFRGRTLMLVALCGNLLVLRYFRKRYMDNAMRGVVLPTMVYVVSWFAVYGKQLLNIF